MTREASSLRAGEDLNLLKATLRSLQGDPGPAWQVQLALPPRLLTFYVLTSCGALHHPLFVSALIASGYGKRILFTKRPFLLMRRIPGGNSALLPKQTLLWTDVADTWDTSQYILTYCYIPFAI